ncbi:flagellar protein FlaG [Pelagirhabdus alkalitolerans]|uniref:Flagellar protein FlaG n=1 Tax=Pelagirhabdus alkalitolerans TaxID=1612202 RepID=A0A1G6MSQ4_9BACI|nr:flagellar protein FlaG [Pelagirhabdus alkalitolerans]SDC58247.1 flagellar protein FlaG [Pelagirhabdus alkalitolerans]
MDVNNVMSQGAFSSRSTQERSTVVPDRSASHVQPTTQPTREAEQHSHSSDLNDRRADIESMVDGLNEFLEPVRTSIKFEMHDKLERYYVKVVDSQTEELIREIPPEDMLDMYAAMAEFMGFIVDEKI